MIAAQPEKETERDRREIDWMRGELEHALVQLVDGERRIEELQRALAERDAAITALRQSTSWRITRPVRVLKRLISGAGSFRS